MALTLPLQVVDSMRRCYYSVLACTSSGLDDTVYDNIIAHASLFDVIKWQRVSRGFRKAAHKRLDAYKRIDVRVYKGLHKLRADKAKSGRYDWHPSVALMVLELGSNHLGIAVDSALNWKDVRELLHLLMTFRNKTEQLFIDSPVIELLVQEVNNKQVNFLLAFLCSMRNTDRDECLSKVPTMTIAPITEQHSPEGPFFPHLKQLTITSQSNQLEHLSRLLSYAVSVNLIYQVETMDLVSLKLCLGNSWAGSRNFRLFRHLTKFRQWTEANTLGERYFQQFDASPAPKGARKRAH